jgi:solute carrier family 8 (sodium/calcium exchanger)
MHVFIELISFVALQANQSGSSNAMELDGAKQCFKFITEKGLKVSSFISDRHLGVAKWICETHPDVQHYNDLWHVNKSLKKKLFDASNRHLYWCARSTRQGFGEMIVAKRGSLIRHISNKHKDHPDELYTECAHGEVEPRAWIPVGKFTK